MARLDHGGEGGARQINAECGARKPERDTAANVQQPTLNVQRSKEWQRGLRRLELVRRDRAFLGRAFYCDGIGTAAGKRRLPFFVGRQQQGGN